MKNSNGTTLRHQAHKQHALKHQAAHALPKKAKHIFLAAVMRHKCMQRVVWACARPANAAVLALELVSACSHTALSRRTGPTHKRIHTSMKNA